MLNVMKSEFYKVLHRKCMYVFFLVFGLGGFLFNFVLKMLEADSKAEFRANAILDGWIQIIVILGWFIVYMIAQIVHSNESKTLVLKNSIAYGTNRTNIYLGRFLTEVLSLVIAVAIVSVLVLAGCVLVFDGITFTGVKAYYTSIGSLMVMWIAAVSMAHALAMVLNSNTLATVIYILYFSLAPDLISLVKFALPNNGIVSFISKYEIRTITINSSTGSGFGPDAWKCFVVAGVYFVVSFIVGIMVFRKREVK
ncbi:MAG: hypothetical protein Q4F05_01235 [bacterium]|nr:hypothetical protein [bacterium]